MAKTRSQSKKKSESKSIDAKQLTKNFKKTKSKAKEIIVPRQFQSCRVKLNRISQEQINLWLSGPMQTDNCIKPNDKKKYGLRNRTPTVVAPKSAQKSLKQLVVASQMAFCTSKAIRIWDNLKKQTEKQKINLKVDQIVCARMSGHRPWPSKIVAFQKNGIKLKFFGTHDIGVVKKCEVIPYEMCGDVLEQYLKIGIDMTNNRLNYHLSFIKACKETSSQNV